MANLLSILRRRPDEIARLSQQDYLAQLAAAPWYAGQSTLYSVGRRPVESVPNSYLGYAEAAYASCTVVGACMRVRRDIFSQARFTWRELTDDGTGTLSHDDALDLLGRPWPNGTTGQLLTKMITDVDLCGNAYIVNEGDRLRWRRPDWMFVVLSGDPNVDDEVDVLGYVYTPGGCGLASGKAYTVAEVAHWAPIPRPGSEYIGMSWMTSALREIQADKHATDHKLNFFVNGASLGPVFRLPATMTAEQFKKFRAANEEAHVGVENAYKPLYIGGGAEVTLSAATFQQLELKATQGAGESRIASNAGIHPTIAGFSEGLAGSSLNAGNFTAARRLVADITLHKLWQDACDTLASFVKVPDGKELWIRERAIPFLREDAKDAAEIFAVDAQSATQLVREGYEPESVTPAVAQRNILLLKHSGALSVQLQEPGAGPDGQSPEPANSGFYFDDQDDAQRAEIRRDATFESKHRRGRGGKFVKMTDRIFGALTRWADEGMSDDEDPLEGFRREHLREALKARGITPKRGGSEADLKAQLRQDVRKVVGKGAEPDKSTKSKRSIADLIKADAAAQEAVMREVYEGTFGDFHTKIEVNDGAGKLYVAGKIYDRKGRQVGEFSRTFGFDEDGKVHVHHGTLVLDRKVQGAGFSNAFNGQAMDFYRSSGVDYVYLRANADVGGYAWASQGYDFMGPVSSGFILQGLRETVASLREGRNRDRYGKPLSKKLTGASNLEDQLEAAEALLMRVESTEFGQPGYPSAYEISQLGRPPGAGRDDVWLGKALMLGSTWEGMLWLTEQ